MAIRPLILLFALSIISLQSNAQCNPTFSDTAITITPNPYDYQFVNTSFIPNPGQTDWDWYFTGGSPATSTNPDTVNVTFNGPGNYSVCLYMDDSVQPCIDSFCTSITVPGTPLSISTNSTSATCNSCNGSLMVTVTGGTAPYTYLWSNASTSQTITNLCPGGYAVTVTDAFGATEAIGASIDTTTNFNVNITANNSAPCPGDTVTLTATINGSGSYTYDWNTGATAQTIDVTSNGDYEVTVTDTSGCISIDSLLVDFEPMSISFNKTDETCVNCCDGSATANVTSGSGNYAYSWSSGSMTASTTALCPGTYTVTVSDNVSGCVQTENTTINAFPCYMISGTISQGFNTRVYLIEEVNGFLSALDSTEVDSSGFYQFTGVCNGIYYVKGALLPAHNSYNSFIPTYYDTAALWSQANALVLNGSSMYNLDFSLLAGNNTGGPGFVGGLISQGANRGEGDPVPGVQVIVTNNEDEVIAFDRSDLQGEFGINNLPIGDYKLYVDLLNKTSYPIIFSITEENPSVNGSNFLVFEESVRPETANGLVTNFNTSMSIYPNPALDHVSIESDELIEEITLISIMGEELKTIYPNAVKAVMTLDDLASGQYLIRTKYASNTTYHILVNE